MVGMHVDGFRFDLASVLGRDRTGKLLANAPLLERIAKDPILKNVQIIAEDWDAAVARGRGIVFGRSTNLPPEPEIECHPTKRTTSRARWPHPTPGCGRLSDGLDRGTRRA